MKLTTHLRLLRLGTFLILVSIPFSGWTADLNEVDYPPPKPKKSSWKANVFVGSALIAAAAGIVVICWDGGTSNEATERLNEKDHRHRHRHHHHRHQEGFDTTNLEVYE